MKRLLVLLAAAALAVGVLAGTAAAAPVAAPQAVHIVVKSDVQHAKRGSDGKWHDAFLPAGFTVHRGAKVTVTVVNHDNAPHMMASPKLGLSAMIAAGSGAKPKTTSFTFTATKAGNYVWMCAAPCDPWAMTHAGFMTGTIRVV